jgi:OOP family OmpA-OmpF porin
MLKGIVRIVFLMGIIGMLVGCAAQVSQAPPTFQVQDLSEKLKSGLYTKKVDNFIVIFDASGSMGDLHGEYRKLDLARSFVSHMNQTIPDGKMMGGLRALGQGACLPGGTTSIIYGMEEYSRAGMAEAVSQMTCAGGKTFMEVALNAAACDLKGLEGKTAVIVVSDSIFQDDLPVEGAKNIKGQYGEDLCIYAVQVGNNPGGKALMEQIAQVGECGFAVNADNLLSGAEMASFVEKVFFTAAVDSDGDGVPDTLDECPGTKKGVKVDEKGCPVDSDGDGVPDLLDACPDTPRGVKVDARGCPIVAKPGDADGDGVIDALDICGETPRGASVDVRGCWVLRPVLFDFDKFNIKPEYDSFLDEVADILRENPDLSMVIQGHTDNVGAAAYNQRLSEIRAQAVLEYLVNKGLSRDRFEIEGYGFSRPVATNKTGEGRAQNRRAVMGAMQ